MTHQITYSFNYHYNPDLFYSVNVPLAKLEGMELNVENVRSVVEEDLVLIAELMGDDLKSYEAMSLTPHLYQKELQRLDENIHLVFVESVAAADRVIPTEEESDEFDAEIVSLALQQVVSDVDYSLHQNLFCNEWSGKNRYPDLARKFINIYTHSKLSV